MSALVILDCDGVLVDSEAISNRVLAEELTAAGVPTTPAQSEERYMGHSLGSVLADAQTRLGAPLPGSFAERYRERSFAAFAAELRPVAGVEAALDALEARGLATCVASSGEHRKVRHTLGLTGLLPRFEGRLFSATEVARGKPHPDLFLHAADRMGAAPEECVVVEDSPVGARAGRAAGMVVLGYAGRTTAPTLTAEGALAFSAMAELPALVAGSTKSSGSSPTTSSGSSSGGTWPRPGRSSGP